MVTRTYCARSGRAQTTLAGAPDVRDTLRRMAPVLLYPFRYRDPRTGRWVRARYVAEPNVIAQRYAEWEITGPAEGRGERAGWFRPYRMLTHAELARLEEPPLEMNPHLATPPAIDELERCLALTFLRRYVTWCARTRRFASMNGAARLRREIVEGR